jgi:hypothetical protein
MTAIAVTARLVSSQTISRPSTLAPTSTLSTDSPRTSAQARSVHSHQGASMPNVSFICPASSPPKKP